MKQLLALIVVFGILYFYLSKKENVVAAPISIPTAKVIAAPGRNPYKNKPIFTEIKSSRGKSGQQLPIKPINRGPTYPEIEDLIKKDDVCGMAKIINSMKHDDQSPVFIDAFFEHVGLDQYKDLFGVQGPLYKKISIDNATEQQKFIEAMVEGSFTVSHRKEPLDPEKSLKLLKGLSQSSPNNLIYDLYQLAAEMNLGRKLDARETVNGLINKSDYSSIFQSVQYDTNQHLWDSATMMVLAEAVLLHLPSMNLYKMAEAFSDSEVDEKTSRHVGEILVKDGLNSKKIYMAREFDTSVYYYGNQLLGDKYPDVMDLSQEKDPEGWDRALQFNVPTPVGIYYDPELCNPEEVRAYFQKRKNIF
ncbi:MAG: hypothetical protein H6623_06165 [Bdellovibrionaceae bacterium]|nr:hypothetical protein [Pseudobdellovibrionaceae bacterium]